MYEEINLEGSADGIKKAAKEGNRALGEYEKTAETANANVQKALDKTGEAMVRVSSKSQTSINRIVESLNKRAAAASAGADPIAQLESQQIADIARLRGNAAAINQVEAAYRQLIKAKRDDIAASQAAERENLIRSLERQAARASSRAAGVEFDRAEALRGLGGGASVAELNRLNTAYDSLAQKAREADRAQELASKPNRMSAAIANVRQFAAVYASLAVILGLVAGAVNASIDLSDQARRTEIFFTKTFQSAELAKKGLIEIREIARDSSVFDLRSANEGAKALTAFGFTAQQIPRFLRAIGDASSVLGEDRIQRLTIALGQIQTKGRVQAQELLQLQEAGISATEILARGFNKTTAEILKLVEKGVVPASTALDLLVLGVEQKFGGMDKQFNSLATGILNQIKQEFQEIGIELGRIFDEPIKKSLTEFREFLTFVRQTVSEFKAITGDINPLKIITNPAELGAELGTATARRLRRPNQTREEVERMAREDAANLKYLETNGLRVVERINRSRTQGKKDQMLLSVYAQAELDANIKNEKVTKAREKSLANAERVSETLKSLRDDVDDARLALSFDDKKVAAFNVELQKTKRELKELNATPTQIANAESLRRQKFAIDQVAEARANAGEILKKFKKDSEDFDEAEAKRLEFISGQYRDLLKLRETALETAQRADSSVLDQLDRSSMESAGRRRDIAIAQLEAVNRRDVAGQIATVNERLAIEIDYLNKKTALEMEQLKRKSEAEISSLIATRQRMADRGADTADVDREIKSAVDSFNNQWTAMETQLIDERTLAQIQATQKISQIQVDANQRVMDEWRDAFSRTIDALTTRFRGWGDFLKSFMSAFLLTPAKEFAATMFAAMMTGNSVRGQLAGATAGGGRSLGIFGTLFGGGGGLGGFGGGFGPRLGSAATPGGTGTFTGQPIGGLGRGGGLGNFGLAGGGGGLREFLGLGNSIQTGAGSATTFGAASFSQKLSALGKSNASLLGGGLLVADGLRRRSIGGAVEAGIGGALIGFKFGGPLGAAIGAAAGFGAGMIARLFKKGEDKARELIKQAYAVDIKDKNILRLFTQMAKNNFGGDLRLAIFSPEARELIQTYKLTQGDKSGLPGFPSNTPRALSLLQQGGALSRVSLPGIVAGAAAPAVNVVSITMDGASIRDAFSGYTVTAINSNPRAVADSAAVGRSSSFGRGPFSELEPGTLF